MAEDKSNAQAGAAGVRGARGRHPDMAGEAVAVAGLGAPARGRVRRPQRRARREGVRLLLPARDRRRRLRPRPDPDLHHHRARGQAGSAGGRARRSSREAFASSDDVRKATGLFGLVLTIFFATSFTTSLQRVYLRAWRRPPRGGIDVYWHGVTWLAGDHWCPRRSRAPSWRARRRARSGPVRAAVARRSRPGCGVHRLVAAARRGARAGAGPDRRDHQPRPHRLRALRGGLDAGGGDAATRRSSASSGSPWHW